MSEEMKSQQEVFDIYYSSMAKKLDDLNVDVWDVELFNDLQDKNYLKKEHTWEMYQKYIDENKKMTLPFNFKEKNLIEQIHIELSKTHIGDDSLKLTTFLTATSGLLANQKRRMSIAITGNSSEGKDNLIKTVFKHQPEDTQIFLTSGTQATIEDDTRGKRQIAFSEVNANRENGANKFLVEVIKQKTEGGTSALKKDIRTGMKTARHEEGEQASVLYGTTEAMMDEEMQTRFIKGTITTDIKRIRKVNENTLDTFSDIDKLLMDSHKEDSWIRRGLTYFYTIKEQPEVYIPYAIFLKECIDGQDIFDHSDPRSQRDIKRVLALTCALTYIFQEQRQTLIHEGKTILVSEPQDLINTLLIASEFFNQSYSGLDKRLMDVLKSIDNSKQEWTPRDTIQHDLEVTLNTVKGYCKTLLNEGLLLEGYGRNLNDNLPIKIYDGNKVYYKRCQKGVKKPLIRCEINKLKTYLEEKTRKLIDTFDISSLSSLSDEFNALKGIKNKGIKKSQDTTDNLTSDKIDTFPLTPFTGEELKKAGLTEEEVLEASL